MYHLKHISNINNEDLYFVRLVISVTWVQQHFLENGPASSPDFQIMQCSFSGQKPLQLLRMCLLPQLLKCEFSLLLEILQRMFFFKETQ